MKLRIQGLIIECTLTHADWLLCIRSVLSKISDNFPADFTLIKRRLSRVEPFNLGHDAEGPSIYGQTVPDPENPGRRIIRVKEYFTAFNWPRFADVDPKQLSVAHYFPRRVRNTFAHELGHIVTRQQDRLAARKVVEAHPNVFDRPRSRTMIRSGMSNKVRQHIVETELIADMYARKWGFRNQGPKPDYVFVPGEGQDSRLDSSNE